MVGLLKHEMGLRQRYMESSIMYQVSPEGLFSWLFPKIQVGLDYISFRVNFFIEIKQTSVEKSVQIRRAPHHDTFFKINVSQSNLHPSQHSQSLEHFITPRRNPHNPLVVIPSMV